MSRIAQRTKLVVVAMVVTAVAALAFAPVGGAFSAGNGSQVVVADDPTTPPAGPVLNHRCPTCMT